jgi:hypothetical protein
VGTPELPPPHAVMPDAASTMASAIARLRPLDTPTPSSRFRGRHLL